jgi:hypothetical protein
MSGMCNLLVCLLLLAVGPRLAWSRSFPSTPDATEAAQERWGSTTRGYIAEGCWSTASATLTLTVQACRAFALETTGAAAALKGWSEATLALTVSGGDGRYWVGGRVSPGLALPGWTCLDGRHYCWTKSETPPAALSGLVVLSTSQVTAGAVIDSVVMAPWRRTQPYSVPAGVTITLGVCPEAGRWPLWSATGVSTGLIRFGPGACGQVYPEWWGADPTGRTDATAFWQQTIDAVSGMETTERVAIQCDGVYKLTSALTVRPRLHIQGHYKPSTTGDKTVSCELQYEGTGNAFTAPDIRPTLYHDLDFRFLRLRDMNQTAEKAFEMYFPLGMTQDNLLIEGFKIPWYLMGSLIYSQLSNVTARFYRERCMEISGPANFANVDVTCGASLDTVIHGVRVGVEPSWFSVSQNLTLRASVEAASGTPIIVAEQRGLNAELYVEQPGRCDAYSIYGGIWLYRLHGGRIHLTATGNCQAGTGTTISRGVYIQSLPEIPEAFRGVNNLLLTGRINSNYLSPLVIEKGPNMWGINVSQLEFAVAPSQLGDFTVGAMIGGSYVTHGLVPVVDEGMGNGTTGTWPVGTLIWNQGAANTAASYFHQVVTAGNPPEVARLILPATNDLVAAGTDATPSVRQGNTFYARLLLEGGATPITQLDGGLGGLCVDLYAQGARTIEHNTNLRLAGGVNYAMAAGHALRLCADTNLGPWREQSRCDTCVP